MTIDRATQSDSSFVLTSLSLARRVAISDYKNLTWALLCVTSSLSDCYCVSVFYSIACSSLSCFSDFYIEFSSVLVLSRSKFSSTDFSPLTNDQMQSFPCRLASDLHFVLWVSTLTFSCGKVSESLKTSAFFSWSSYMSLHLCSWFL